MADEPAAKCRRTTKYRPKIRGHIERLIIENFKSYAGLHEVGPFDKFTCIIGPNGSGKSNIMDAISFCLGIRARHLRGDRLRDLIHHREEEDVASNTRSAKVTIVFRTADGDCLHFGRYVNSRGEGTYRYGPPENVQGLGYDEFLRHLAEQKIFVKARNFLVFQGDVMELARRQGTELTGALETISGSEKFKDRYIKLSKDLEITQERARLHFQHRREVEDALSRLEEQKAEVNRFLELRARRDRLSLESMLFKLLCADREWDRGRRDGDRLHKELAQGDADLATRKAELVEKDAQRKKLDADADRLSTRIPALVTELDQAAHEGRTMRDQVMHWERRLKEREVEAQQEDARREKEEEALRAAREARAKVEADIERLKHEQWRPTSIPLTAAQRTAYDEAVALSDLLNTRQREELRKAEDVLGQYGRDRAADQRELQDVEAGRARGLEKLEEIRVERTSVKREMEEESLLLEQRKREASKAAEEVRRHLLFEETLLEDRSGLRSKLDAAAAMHERLELAESRKRVADELRAAFPGAVLGRISEVLLPTQKRFDTPLQMALGSRAEAFIVRDAAAGRRCVGYMRERRIGTETFLPLDRITPPRAGALHLLTQGHQARRLATHCVQLNEKFLERQELWRSDGSSAVDRAMNYLLNGTIIVDSLDEAKRAAYHDAPRSGLEPLVVTLGGEVIHTNGNMSVQSMTSLGRIEFGEAEQLHEIQEQEDKLRELDADLEKLRAEVGRKRQHEAELQEQARDISDRHEVRKGRIRLLEASEKAEQKLVKDRAGRAEEIKRKIEEGARSQAATEEKREKLERELAEKGKKHFAQLNRELGVADVRGILLKEQRERVRLRQEIERKEDFVKTLASEERSRESRLRASSRLDALRQEVGKLKADIEASSKRREELTSIEGHLKRRFHEAKERVRELRRQSEGLEELCKTRKTDLQRFKLQVEDVRRRTRRHRDMTRGLLDARCGIFRDCHERGATIPLLDENEAAMDLVLSREQDLDGMDAARFADFEAQCWSLRVDYSALPQVRKDLASRTALADVRPVEVEYEAQVAAVDRELSSLSPNQMAPAECAAEEERLGKIKKQEQDAVHESQRLSREFEIVRSERTARFMECYRHVEAKVHSFYKDLTAYDGFDGGSAYLDLDDPEEPYNGGIIFTACPPGKRFFPMEQLSGGERSMASMALLFAMHSFQPPPFMVLDEVDAPFDHKNTRSLVHYLKQLDFQTLVISLKDAFFSHSDSIVGIFKDRDQQTSGALNLPLKEIVGTAVSDVEVPLAQVMNEVEGD